MHGSNLRNAQICMSVCFVLCRGRHYNNTFPPTEKSTSIRPRPCCNRHFYSRPTFAFFLNHECVASCTVLYASVTLSLVDERCCQGQSLSIKCAIFKFSVCTTSLTSLLRVPLYTRRYAPERAKGNQEHFQIHQKEGHAQDYHLLTL